MSLLRDWLCKGIKAGIDAALSVDTDSRVAAPAFLLSYSGSRLVSTPRARRARFLRTASERAASELVFRRRSSARRTCAAVVRDAERAVSIAV
jgi:hypothetical protein